MVDVIRVCRHTVDDHGIQRCRQHQVEWDEPGRLMDLGVVCERDRPHVLWTRLRVFDDERPYTCKHRMVEPFAWSFVWGGTERVVLSEVSTY